MGLTMKKILDRFSDCNVFSLIGRALNYNITDEEFLNALNKIENSYKQMYREMYEKNKDEFVNYPEFDKLYAEVKKECYDFGQNLNKYYNDEKIERLKKIGFCHIIGEHVGKTTKYGSEQRDFFLQLYFGISMCIKYEKDKKKYCINNGKSPLEQIPEELKEHLLYYEASFFNSWSCLSINYYFKLNDDTKKYLLKFRNDFCLEELEDLSLYKDNELKFSSCTHEGFNSIEFDYKNMTNNEIVDYINDEFFEEDNKEVIKIIDKLIKMETGTIFSFKEFDIEDGNLVHKICHLCDGINLRLISSKDKQDWAMLCQLDFKNMSFVYKNENLEKVR